MSDLLTTLHGLKGGQKQGRGEKKTFKQLFSLAGWIYTRQMCSNSEPLHVITFLMVPLKVRSCLNNAIKGQTQ